MKIPHTPPPQPKAEATPKQAPAPPPQKVQAPPQAPQNPPHLGKAVDTKA